MSAYPSTTSTAWMSQADVAALAAYHERLEADVAALESKRETAREILLRCGLTCDGGLLAFSAESGIPMNVIVLAASSAANPAEFFGIIDAMSY